MTFNEMIIEAIARRDELTAWIALGRRHRGRDRRSVARARHRRRAIPSRGSRPRSFSGPHFPLSEWVGAAALCRAGTSNDQKQCERLTDAAAASGVARIDSYLDVFCTQKSELRSSILTSTLAKRHPDLARRLDNEQARVGALLASPPRGRDARAHRRAAHHRGRRHRALRRREGAPRAARLRRPDRQDAAPARPRTARVGALQARSRHRSRADRRGAGHEPEAMGDRRSG